MMRIFVIMLLAGSLGACSQPEASPADAGPGGSFDATWSPDSTWGAPDASPDEYQWVDGPCDAGPNPPRDGAVADWSSDVGYPQNNLGWITGKVVPNIVKPGYPADWEPRPNTSNCGVVWQDIALGDYNDPNQNRGLGGGPLKLLWVDLSGLDCAACMAEAGTEDQKCADRLSKGLVCLTVIVQGQTAGSKPTHDDVVLWRDTFYSDHHSAAITLDRNGTWGDSFGASALPMNIFIDLRTMTILKVISGYNESEIDAFLASHVP
jgi:hypothetical protein